MTTRRNTRQSQTRVSGGTATPAPASAPVEAIDETQDALMQRLRRMADEVEHLQTEIAAVEAFVTDPAPARAAAEAPVADPAAAPIARPGSTWTPTPTPQPWLVARSA